MPSASALTASRAQTPGSDCSPGALEGPRADQPGESPDDAGRDIGRKVLLAALLVGAALRLVFATQIGGIYWPDETMKSLEQAHRVVYGYGFVPWEFVNGASHWAWPGILAGVLKLAALVGLDEPGQYLRAIQVLLALAGVATTYGCYRLARAHGASPLTASAGAALFALAAPAVYFSHRALSETASTLPVVLGLALTLRPAANRRQIALGSCLLGLSVLLRIQNGIFPVLVLLELAARRNRRAMVEAAATLAAWAVLYGFIDLLTWGSWFHSAGEYIRFNILEGRSSEFGTADVFFYVRVLVNSMGLPGTLVLLGLSALAVRRAPRLVLGATVYFLAHSFVPHKEGRFLLPLLPVLCGVAAIGLNELGQLVGQRAMRLGVVTVLFAAVASIIGLPHLTIGDVGEPGGSASAYSRNDSVNRLLLAAHDREDLCGLRIDDADVTFTGSYAYLHRPVPIYNEVAKVRSEGVFNYVIAWAGREHLQRGEVIARDGGFVLIRLSMAGCTEGAVSGPVGGPLPDDRVRQDRLRRLSPTRH